MLCCGDESTIDPVSAERRESTTHAGVGAVAAGSRCAPVAPLVRCRRREADADADGIVGAPCSGGGRGAQHRVRELAERPVGPRQPAGSIGVAASRRALGRPRAPAVRQRSAAARCPAAALRHRADRRALVDATTYNGPSSITGPFQCTTASPNRGHDMSATWGSWRRHRVRGAGEAAVSLPARAYGRLSTPL